MRIRMRSSRRRSQWIELNLASMIDVTFLLLLYFMITMVFTLREDRLSPTLQTESDEGTGAVSDFQPQIVEVVLLQGDPAYKLGERIFRERAELEEALRPLPKEPGVFVHVFDSVPVGFAVSAIQIARDAGFEQVTYVPAK